MRGLADDKNIIIKKADKGSCVVVWDREDYLAEGYKQLEDEKNYGKVKKFGDDRLKELVSRSDDFFREFHSKRWVSEKEMKYFTFEFKKTSCLGKMYLLPKIHKRTFNVPGRPVISNCGTPTEKVSEFLDFHLKPVMMAGKSYVKDTGHFLEKLKGLGRIPQNSILVTADVIGLYPSIPHQGGLEALFEKLEERQDRTIPSNELVKMAEFVLKNNYFEFNSDIYHQKSGTAIGTKFAPPYACLFMDRVETEFLNKELIKPWVWLRYIDDIFFVWTAGERQLQLFLERLNSFHPDLKFTHEMSKSSVNFLDLVVKLEGNELVTDLYCKPTDCHQFLEYNSAHPIHTKRSIVYSQGLRIKRLCTKESDFEKHSKEMKNWFLKRNYPQKLIDKQLQRVNKVTRNQSLQRKLQVKGSGVPLVVTFHPLLSSLGTIIHNHLQTLHSDQMLKEVFTPAPFVSFRAGYSLKNHLVRAKVYPLERKRGSFKCGKSRCLVCRNVKVTPTFNSLVDGEEYVVNHEFNCDSRCVVYLLICKVCNKQYVGQTTQRFRERWNLYRQHNNLAIKGGDAYQKQFHLHFEDENHNGLFNDVEITFIDKTDAEEPRAREKFWIYKLKTLLPHGLNSTTKV